MLITVSSIRGAPGATSLALLLTSAWPDHEVDRVLVEADCDGGVLGARYQLGVEPGAVSLISACGRRSADLDPASVGRPVAERVWIVPGPEVAGPASAAWAAGAVDVAARLAADPGVWVIDAGRLGAMAPTWPLAAGAEARVLVTGSALEDLVQVPDRVRELRSLAPDGGVTGVVVMGATAHPRPELARFFATDQVWILPTVTGLATTAFAAATGRGRARRQALWRAVVDLAVELAAELAVPPGGRPTFDAAPPVPSSESESAEGFRWSATAEPPATGWPATSLATGPADGWGRSA
ncbi:MAG: hypothetical protein ACK5PP_15535 [Acidimicrobiales bacterium]